MSIQAVSNVSFGATTKSGNEYKKSHAGTIGGTALGAAFGGYTAYKNVNAYKTFAGKKAQLQKTKDLLNKMGIEAPKFVKGQLAKSIKIASVASVAGFALIGLGLGAIVNKMINKSAKEKADEAAETPKA